MIPGSTRAASTNMAVLRTVRQVATDGVVAVVYDQLSELPAFNPDNEGANAGAAVAELRRQLADADAVLFCTPEYAGTLPGSLKNLLDWTVGTGDLYGKPVAWINAANAGRGEGAQATLALVLGYVGAVPVEAACLDLPGARDAVGPSAGGASFGWSVIGDPSSRRWRAWACASTGHPVAQVWADVREGSLRVDSSPRPGRFAATAGARAPRPQAAQTLPDMLRVGHRPGCTASMGARGSQRRRSDACLGIFRAHSRARDLIATVLAGLIP